WSLPRLHWDDGDTLRIDASASLAGDGLQALGLEARSADLAALPERYLSGWLGLAGLSGLSLRGGMDVDLVMADGAMRSLDATLDGVDLLDSRGRLRIEGLAGDLRHRVSGRADGRLSWRGGSLYELGFGPIALPLQSRDGTLRLREPASLSML